MRKKKIDYSLVKNLVYVYLRVSTERQRQDGKGLEAQLADCKTICKELGLEIYKVVSDPGLSGTLPYTERPGLLEAMTGCENGEAGGIIAYNQDRYARGMGADETIRKHALQHGYMLLAGRTDITKEENDIPADAMAFVATIERKMIVKRLRGGRKQRAEVDGRGTAPVPLGYTITITSNFRGENIQEVIINEETAPVVRLIFRMVKIEGKSYRYVADYLNRNGYKSPYAGRVRKSGAKAGKPFSGSWSFGQIQKVVDNYELYTTGVKIWDGIEAELKWPILFSENTLIPS